MAGLKDLFASLLVVGGVLAAVSHALLRLVYLAFYRPFGITPEEVGLGRTELLLQTLAGPVVIVAMTALYLIVLLLLALLLIGVAALVIGAYFEWLLLRVRRDESTEQMREDLQRAEGSLHAKAAARRERLNSFYRASGVDVDAAEADQQPNPVRVCLRRSFQTLVRGAQLWWGWLADREHRRYVLLVSVVLLVTTVSAGLTGAGLARAAEEHARSVIRSGEPVYVVEFPLLPISSATAGVLPALQLRAIPARVTAADRSLPAVPDGPGDALFLGTDGEHLLLYVPDDRRTVRLPVADVALDLETEPDPPLVAELAAPPATLPDGADDPDADEPEVLATVLLTLSPFREVACYELDGELEPAATGLALHAGRVERPGDVLVSLHPGDADATDGLVSAEPAEAAPPTACVPVTADHAADVLRDPDRYHLQVSTAAVPEGVLLGQLAAP